MARIRAATVADAKAIAFVHVESWRTTYADIVPAPYLASLSAERRAAYWKGVLQKPPERYAVLVAEVGGKVVGFASAGASREGGEDALELYALYLLAEAQGKGIGRALFTAAVAAVAAHGKSLFTWVLEGNPAEAFYRRMGGVKSGEKWEDVGGVSLREFRYRWTL